MSIQNWYVRLSRRRFWRSEMNTDKQSAYETLFECLKVTAQLMSPGTILSDWLYRNLTDSLRSNAIAAKPLQYSLYTFTYLTKAETNMIDAALRKEWIFAQRISSMVLALRKKVNIKVRQPLQNTHSCGQHTAAKAIEQVENSFSQR